MAWDKGFNFRATSGFVTDGTNETYVIGDTYPTTRNSVTFGWPAAPTTADKNSGIDRRMAGINSASNTGAPKTFRVDLPVPGLYGINIAIGSAPSSTSTWHRAEFLDNVKSIYVVDTGSILTSSGAWYDAVTVKRAGDVIWAAVNVRVVMLFASTILNLNIGANNANATVTELAHLSLSYIGSDRSGYVRDKFKTAQGDDGFWSELNVKAWWREQLCLT